MKEINDIILAYHRARSAGIRMALATVVNVEGSSYRQPGARMLVTEDGSLTGAISGGCLEGDALRKALLAIHQQQNKLITYDTSEEGNMEFGVQLGCNGIVHILFEYIDPEDHGNPVMLLEQLKESRREAVVTTLFSRQHRQHQQGTLWVTDAEGLTAAGDAPYPQELTAAAASVLRHRRSTLVRLQYDSVEQEALVEYRPPGIKLYIIGAGNDAKPLVELAAVLGWETTVIDGRATHATKQRFPKALDVRMAPPEGALAGVETDPFTAFVLMTHNYHYDLAVLNQLVETDTPYIGSLGPKTKLQRMIDELETMGRRLTGEQRNRIYGPVGLDIGAEAAEQIALSVVAEITAVLHHRTGGSLRERPTKIHHEIPTVS